MSSLCFGQTRYRRPIPAWHLDRAALIAKKQIEIAEKVRADAVAHGATGKGNDQVRFEPPAYALKPDVTVIAPWREWDLTSRSKLIECRKAPNSDRQGQAREAPFSVDANLLHTSEGKVLEDPAQDVPDYVSHARSIRNKRPTTYRCHASISSVGIPLPSTAKDCRRRRCSNSLTISAAPTALAVSIWSKTGSWEQSRGETPGGTILLAGRRGIESITLDRGAAHLKDELMPKYAELLYYGFWFTPERRCQAAIDKPGIRFRPRKV